MQGFPVIKSNPSITEISSYLTTSDVPQNGKNMDTMALNEIGTLLETAREEERKFLRKLEGDQRGLDTARKKIEAYQITLRDLEDVLGLGTPESNEVDAEVVREFQGLSLKEMLRLWAQKHNGVLLMKEMSKTLTNGGLFKDTQSAAGGLYSTLERMPEFRKVARGQYRLEEAKESSNYWGAAVTPNEGSIEDSDNMPF